MKTIPVSILLAGILLPVICQAQPPESSPEPPMREKDGRRGPAERSPGPFLEAWKTADGDGDGFISMVEFDAMPRVKNVPEEKRGHIFKRLDKDNDGKLGRDELGRFGKPHDGQGPPMKRLWELDTNQSGGVDFEEFKAGQLFMKLPADKQQSVFQRLDTDDDGVISPKDRPEPPFNRPDGKPRTRRPDGGADPDKINKKLDADGDGALSFAEFRTGPAVKDLTEDQQEERFEMLDRNGDHKISTEDIPPSAPPAE